MHVSVIRKNGQLAVDIGGKVYPPLAFKSFRPTPENVGDFYRAGVRLFTVLSSGVISGLGIPYSRYGESWMGHGVYDFDPIDRQMEMFLANAPEGYFAPMFQIDTRPWYLDEDPEIPNSFSHLAQIAGDERFRRESADYLRAVVGHCEETYGDRIWGYFLLGGTTTEFMSDKDFEAAHPMKTAAFRKWKNDAEAELPSRERLTRDGAVFLSPEEEDVREARQFHAELIADYVLGCAAAVQDIVKHEKPLGLYFGYLFELGTPRLHNAGHLAYEKVFRSPDIGMIASPSSYQYRGVYDPSAFMLPAKELDGIGKLYFLEFDHRTHTIPTRVGEPINVNDRNTIYKSDLYPGADTRCKNECESLNLMYRDFIFCEANGTALWWFDMLGGWFRSEGMMRAIGQMVEIDRTLSQVHRESAAEVAVFAEGESMYRVRKSSPVADSLSSLRETLAQAGAAYDLYSTESLSAVLDGAHEYRFFIFVNTYDMKPETREAIARLRTEKGKTALFLYAPDYAGNGENRAERISAVTGIRVKEDCVSHGALRWEEETLPGTAAPWFSPDDPKTEVFARFEDGAPAAAIAETGGFRSVYLAHYRLPASLLRSLYQRAGVFVYSGAPNVYTYANSAFLGVYNAGDENAVLQVPQDGVYRDLIRGGEYRTENGTLTLPVRDIRAFMLVPGAERD